MSEQTAQEPTMEEILASIRRIISEDDAPAGEGAAAAEDAEDAPEAALPEVEVEPEPEPEPEPVVAAAEEVEDEVLELTERVETHGDIEAYVPEPAAPEPVAAAPPPAPEPAPVAAAPAPAPTAEGLVSAVTATAAASAFGQLSASILMPRDNVTLEDVVRDLLRPLLKDWLDNNLAGIVQAAVAEEVERIARQRGR